MEIRTVAIVGSGAVGIYYGCRIEEAGRTVRFLLRSDYETVRKVGLRARSVDGDMTVPSPLIYDDSKDLGTVDLVVVCWKATANAAAQAVISPLLHKGTRILTLQNGLGNVEYLEKTFGPGRVLGGLCFVCINRVAAGEVVHQGGGMITVGEFQQSGVLSQMADVFGNRVKITTVDNLATAQWRKLVWNIPFNGLCIVEGGIDTQDLLQRPCQEEVVRSLMLEVITAAGALGYPIPEAFIEEQIRATRTMGRYRPSSLLDYQAGHPLEVEAIWREPLRRAKSAGVAVPHLEQLTARLRRLDLARSHSSS